MAMISVEEALDRTLAAIDGPVGAEEQPIAAAVGRSLARDLRATRDQPPFPASAMDGYAVRAADVTHLPATLRVIGTSVAGRRYAEPIGEGEAVRIFTGAPLPDGADSIVIQEETERTGDVVVVRATEAAGRYVRAAGLDFRNGDALLRAGDVLDARRITLAAAAGHGTLPVYRRPRIGILATGDELVTPGGNPQPDQIFASNPYGVRALVERAGGEAVDLGIAKDSLPDLASRIAAARTEDVDILVTLGGASVGDHDLVQQAFSDAGMELGFWRVALRPGKPLMHGRLGRMLLLGLPGNPVSSLVCGILFLVPAIRALLGDPSAAADPTEAVLLGADLAENDGRQDYLRAKLSSTPDGRPLATPHAKQDSSMVALLVASDALIVRAPRAPRLAAGETCRIIRLDQYV